jgi:hypothetical protein
LSIKPIVLISSLRVLRLRCARYLAIYADRALPRGDMTELR